MNYWLYIIVWIVVLFLVILWYYVFSSDWPGVDSVTLKWEWVKSKSEKMIADCLYKMWIQYIYEHPLTIDWRVVAHPDFYLPKYNIWIEFWWLYTKKYLDNKQFKKQKYKEYWLKVIDVEWHNIRNPQKKYLDEKRTQQYLYTEIKKQLQKR